MLASVAHNSINQGHNMCTCSRTHIHQMKHWGQKHEKRWGQSKVPEWLLWHFTLTPFKHN